MNNNLVGGIIPPQPPIQAKSDAHVLKSRLEWGEPAFTILDVRDRETFNEGHITGAMPMPLDQLADRAVASLAKSRDIYVYGGNEEQTSQAAQALRSAGFVHVSELIGGLGAWKAIGGPTEGIVESRTPAGADDYNVVARVKNHLETQQKPVGGTSESTTGSKTPIGSQVKDTVGNVQKALGDAVHDAQQAVGNAVTDVKENIAESKDQGQDN
jgi:rhodanese-related sulfurtransferase